MKEGQACIKINYEHLKITDNKLSGNAFFSLMMTSKGMARDQTSQSIKEFDEKNDVRKLRLIDPWFRISRTEPV